MTEDARREWLNAAWRALRHLPVDLLRQGAEAAMRTADHPSKIVPAIIADAAPRMAHEASIRRAEEAKRAVTALPAPGGERPTSDEIDEVCRRHGVGRYAREHGVTSRAPTQVTGRDPDRACRAPSRDDYIRLFGVDPDAIGAAA